MANCGDICDICGDEVESCDCTRLTKDQLVELLVSDLADTVIQWAIQDNKAEIENLLREQMGFDDLEREVLEDQASCAGLL